MRAGMQTRSVCNTLIRVNADFYCIVFIIGNICFHDRAYSYASVAPNAFLGIY